MTTDNIIAHTTRIPRFIYGTAWKEEHTAALVKQAIEQGFTGIDTANQRVHYCEAAVGDALLDCYQKSPVSREMLFIQTKFTYKQGQDHRLPYDPDADYTTQVRQSVDSSLNHLHTDYLDAFLLHGPSQGIGLVEADLEVWQAMETLQQNGKVKLIGVSNMNVEQLAALYEEATIKPTIVQNRCFARTGWDNKVRAFCRKQGIHYEGFSLLTANREILAHPDFLAIVARTRLTAAQAIFQACLGMGMHILTGTSSKQHMQEDLACRDLRLNEDDTAQIERLLTL
ncbi:aldo/keto reductase [Candidatus Sororendozoicomonas aggregata]|uniref:aldo/keto reductase family protein n=1 Tax=Candidatus Sororendozoicomonas aggregata TaxID=3073239 RepID=UPI002ED5BB37